MKKSKMYDFGVLGKWSKTTLKAQIKKDEYDFLEVPSIERCYDTRKKEIEEKIEEINEIKVKKLTLQEVFLYITVLDNLTDEKKKLHQDYDKYEETLLSI